MFQSINNANLKDTDLGIMDVSLAHLIMKFFAVETASPLLFTLEFIRIQRY